MIRHIVMFKLIPFDTQEAKQAKMQEFKERLEILKEKIDVLRMIRVDFNVNPEEVFDVILTTEFDSLKDLHTYATHPDHLAVGREVIAGAKADRACVDYEF